MDYLKKKIYSNSRESLETSLSDFKNWIEEINSGQKLCLLSQNNPKDLEHLENGYNLINLENPFYFRNLDLHSIAITQHIINNFNIPSSSNFESNLNSRYLSEFVGIPPEPKPHSTALAGAKQTAEIFNRLVYNRNFIEDFKKFEVPKYLKK